MRFIPIGIADGFEAGNFMKATDFSNEMYDGVQLRISPSVGRVLIMHSKKGSPMPWKVVYGMSSVFFRTFEDAVEFCNDRGMQLAEGRTR